MHSLVQICKPAAIFFRVKGHFALNQEILCTFFIAGLQNLIELTVAKLLTLQDIMSKSQKWPGLVK